MSERMPPYEPSPSVLETRRDALLLRIAELREKIKESSLDPEIISKPLADLDSRLQATESSIDIAALEGIIDTLEKIADSWMK
jgi:hypothetical protein